MLHQSRTDRLFQALGDRTRRTILERLGEGPLSAGDLARGLPMTLTAVGQHLRILEANGLIETTKVGRIRTVELRREGLHPVRDWVEERLRTRARRYLPPPSSDLGED
jgi:DNA-binding transcriptional ArsR family regulator